jgi:hypothetical protein
MHPAKFLGVIGVLLLTAAGSSYAANFSLAPTAGTPPSPATAGATNVTYTFATKTKGNKNTAIPLNAAVTVTFPAGTDASAVDTTNSTFFGTKIPAVNYTSITPTGIQFKAPVAVAKNKAFSLQFFGINNPPSAGAVTAIVALTNITGGKDTCKFSYAITIGVPAKLAYKTQPATTANGVNIFPAVQVVVQDAAGNTVPTANDNISIAIGANPGLGTLSPSNPVVVKAVSGIATFTNLSINNPGTGYTLVATDTTQAVGFPTATSNPFNIFFSNANRLSFGQEPPLSPATVTAGIAIAPALTVSIKDASNNVVDTSLAITLSIGNNVGGGTLSGTTTVNALHGVATFSDISIDKAGIGYTLDATAAGPFSTTSTQFTVIAAGPTQLAFVVQPTDTGAGDSSIALPNAISPAMQVALEDAFGNICTGVSGTVSLSISTNPSGGKLTGGDITTPPAINTTTGIATFTDVSIDKAGTGYVLTAASSGLASAVSAPFSITPQSATTLGFSVQPVSTPQFASIFPAVQVAELDPFGNVDTGSTDDITMAIHTGSGTGGAALSGTTTVTAVNGVSIFGDLSIDKTGAGYLLDASVLAGVLQVGSVTVTNATSFSITASAGNHLVFLYQPTDTTAGQAMAPAVQVAIENNAGVIQSAATNSITLNFGTNAGGGTLSGATATAVSGIATFTTLSVDKVGSGYTLIASETLPANTLAPTTSTTFTINPGGLDHFQVTSATGGAIGTQTAGTAFNILVTAQDVNNNTIPTFVGPVVLTSTPGSALAGTPLASGAFTVGVLSGSSGVLLQSVTVLTAQGVTTLTATDPSTGKAGSSNAFVVNAGALNGFLIATTSGGTIGTQIAGAPFAIQLTAVDANNNTVTTFTGTAQITSGNSTLAAAGGIVTTPNFIAGVLSSQSVSVTSAQAGTLLSASALGATSVSNAFTVVPGAANKLAFVSQPSTALANASIFPAVQVVIQDAFGNTVPNASNTISLSIANNPSGAFLSGTTSVIPLNGVSTFSNLSMNLAGTGYTLAASATGLTGIASNSFNITASAGQSHLVFLSQPTNTAAGATIPSFQVVFKDVSGKTVNTTANVTVAIGANPGGGTLTGTLTVAAVGGVATFNTLKIDKTGVGYTLAVSAVTVPATSPASSSAFSITSGGLSKFLVEAVGGGPIPNQSAGTAFKIQITAQDANGNTVTSYAGPVKLTSTGTLTGTPVTSGAFTAGVLSSQSVTITSVQVGTTITATDAGAAVATASAPFAVNAGPVSSFVITDTAGNPIATQTAGASFNVKITALDASGNTATSFTGTVLLQISSSAVLQGAPINTRAFVGGVLASQPIIITSAQSGTVLNAFASGKLGTSNAFTVSPGAINHLTFVLQPSNTQAGSAIFPSVVVAERDVFENTIATDNATSLTMSIATGPAATFLAGSTTAVTVINGVSTFSNLIIAPASTGVYTIQVTDGTRTTISHSFNITASTSNHLAFTAQPPASSASGAAFGLTVSLQDLNGNPVGTAGINVTLAIGNNAGGGTLLGTTTVATDTSGNAIFSGLSIDKAGNGYTLVATAPSLLPDTTSAFNITPSGVTHFLVENFGSGNIPTQTAGTAFNIRITALDGGNNVDTSFVGTVDITSATGILSAGSGTTAAFTAGVLASRTVNFSNTGTFTITATKTGGGPAGTSNAFTVNPGAISTFNIAAIGGQVAGVPFTVNITARDTNGNTVTTFGGTVQITSANSTLSGGTVTSGVFASGVLTGQSLTINSVQAITSITVTGASVSTTSNTFAVTPGTLSTFLVETTGGGAIPGQIAGTAFNVQITALDSVGNTVTSFSGAGSTVQITSSGSLSGTPVTSGVFVNGVLASQSVTILNEGTFTLTAANGGAAGASAPFAVTAGALNNFIVENVGGGNVPPQSANFAFNVRITARDVNNNPIPTFNGNVNLTVPGGVTLVGSPVSSVLSGGVNISQSVTITTIGVTTNLIATNAAGPENGVSNSFTVSGPLSSFTVQIAGGGAIPTEQATVPFNILVTAIDTNNFTVASYSGTVAISSNAALNGAPVTSAAFVRGVLAAQPITVNSAQSGTTLSVTDISGSAGISNPFIVTSGPAPVIQSPLQPSVSPAQINQPVTFTFSASSLLPVTYTYDWGDGTTSTTTSATTVTHTFTVAGTYTINVTATDSSGASTTSQLTLSVVGGGVTPGLCDGFTPGTMTKLKASARLKFPSTSKDSLSVSAVIQLPNGFDPNGKVLKWNIGGIAGQATLGASGSSPTSTSVKAGIRFKKPKKGTTFVASPGTLNISMKNTSLTALQLTGVPVLFETSAKTGDTATLSICALFNNTNAYSATPSGFYKAIKKTTKTGTIGTGSFSAKQ